MSLSHFRVIEIGSRAVATHCTRLLADLDVSVIKTEQSHGDLRHARSFAKTDGVAAKPYALCSEPQAFGDRNRDLWGLEGVVSEGPVGAEMPLGEQWVGLAKKAAR